MMADSSFDASVSTKMLMPHEIGAGASANANTASLVGQHSIHSTFSDIHHGTTSFYHSASTMATSNSATGGFNGFHNSTFHNNSYSHNNHSITTISSTMPPPLILYNQTSSSSSSSAAATTPTSSLYTNTLSNTSVVVASRQEQSTTQHQQLPLAAAQSGKLTTAEGATKSDRAVAATTAAVDGASESNDEQLQSTEDVTNEDNDEPEIDIVISNVVCAFSVRCHLSLKTIALQGANVEFKRENGMVTMKLRKPYTTASIWSSGKITCTGATSEEQAKVAARRYARMLQKLNFRVRFQNYRVVNVLGTCKMPWAIKIVQFSEKYKKEASYEPELHPGVTYNLKNPTATLKIFSTGSMTVTARSVADVQAAIEHIYPLVYEFKKPRTEEINNGETEEVYADIIETDYEMDDDISDEDDAVDPLEDPLNGPIDDDDDDEEVDSPTPPSKKQKFRDISHLTKRYKGPPTKRRGGKASSGSGSKRPLGKMNDPKQDLIYVSDGDVDGDDF